MFHFFRPSAYAPAERSETEECVRQHNVLLEKDYRLTIFDHFPDYILILNKNRQIVFSNKSLNQFLHVENSRFLLGMRPGEALHCNHADNDSGGCGTSEFCKVCGAVQSIMAVLNDEGMGMKECEILTTEGPAMNFRIWTFPFDRDNETFVLCVLRDIAHEKYRNFLEHIFFHDLTNIGAGIYNLLSLIGNNPENYSKYSGMLICLAKEILDEIGAQRDLLDAESGTISINVDTVPSLYLMNSVKTLFVGNPTAEGKTIEIPADAANISFPNDPRLLTRVLGNMVKNALEASKSGDAVRFSCHSENGKIIFSVHNGGVMDEEVQLKVFKRAFSTKGKGRGLGTYSIKLLTERYLHGKAWFSSDPEHGTTFFAEFPLVIPAARQGKK